MTNTKQLLIGGVAGTGKTTLAIKLAKQFCIPWISTDQIKVICGIKPSNEQSQTISAEKQKSAVAWEGVERLIQHPHPWEEWIIEGTAIMPNLVVSLEKQVSVIFILEKSKDDILAVLRERSKLPWINTNTEEQINLKADLLWELNEFIESEADKYGLPTTAARQDNGLRQVVSLLESSKYRSVIKLTNNY